MALRRIPKSLLLFCLIHCAISLPKDELFPYGHSLDLHLANDTDDSNSVEVDLKTPIVFYEQLYHSIYVNENGLVSFLTEISSFFSIPFPLEYPVIAPLYSDVDIRARGAVWFRNSNDPGEIKRISTLIQKHFSVGKIFEARNLLIVTWDDVGYYNLGKNKSNTFQLVVATDGQDSYTLLAYPEKSIQWIQGTGKNTNIPDARAQAGFVSGDGRFYVLEGSGTDQVSNLDKLSNIGVPGLWLFRVGQVKPSDDIQLPDLLTGDSSLQRPRAARTCAIGASLCHSKAFCVDFNPGFCCRCSPGYYGNGRNCLPDGLPQRINGKFSGKVNDIAIEDEDLHAYVATKDGRAYTAISKIPETVGFDLQSLTGIGSVIGWLFGRRTSNAPNGYHLTGGHFNFTSEVDFPQTGHHAVIEHLFQGVDVFNHLKLLVRINGTIPTIPHGSKIEVADYEEEFTRTSPGELKSHARRAFRIEGSVLDIPFTVDHIINYEECSSSKEDRMTSLKLKVNRNFVIYDAREQIVRYAMTNEISSIEAAQDPCVKGRESCVANSTCIVERGTFRCVCNTGFEYIYEKSPEGEKAICVDINECLTGSNRCDSNAHCLNEVGGYKCRCNKGYYGDGFSCQKDSICSRIRCIANSQCVETEENEAECRCLPGFKNDGTLCVPELSPTLDCRQTDLCGHHAACIYNSTIDAYQCQCKRGYNGDGIVCNPETETCEVAANCSPYATCTFDETVQSYRCQCLPGFEGDGFRCARPTCVLGECWCPIEYQYVDGKCQLTVANSSTDETPATSCNEINICHPHAQCILSSATGDYLCQCNAGYTGNGIDCKREEETISEVTDGLSCDLQNICGQHATCIYDDDSLKSVCLCNEGYRGDGIVCTPIDSCNNLLDCDANAQCLFDDQDQRFQCRCNEGFYGDGKTCLHLTKDEEPGCDVLSNCHMNARCILDDLSRRHICQCDYGYSGNGTYCEANIVGCNVIYNCHKHATCLYDALAIGFRCKCKEGYSGNGITCHPKVSCIANRNICHPNGECVWIAEGETDGYYSCQCLEGYRGDGYECKAIPRHDGNFLLVSHGMSILRVPIVPSSSSLGRPIFIQIFQAAVGIDIDCHDGRVYWSDVNGNCIRSTKYDGTDPNMFLYTDIGSPEGIAIDWASRNVYWTDSSKDTIEVANLDTKVRKVLFNTGLVNPRGIAVYPSQSLLFWSDWNRNAPKIEKSFTDGSNRTIFVSSQIQLPNSLTIDYERHELCWTDAGIAKIECIQLNGQNRRIVVSGLKYPFGLTYYKNQLFWTDWEEKTIKNADKITGLMGTSLPIPLGGQGKVYAIVAVPEDCPKVNSSCTVGSGICTPNQICLPNGFHGITCL